MNILGFILIIGVVVFAVFEIIGLVCDLKNRKRVKNSSSENNSDSVEPKQ